MQGLDPQPPVDVLGHGPADADRPPRLLVVALVLALAVTAGLAGWLYVESRDSAEQREVTRAVEAYVAAWNAHDENAVRAASTEAASFAAGESLQWPVVEQTAGTSWLARLRLLFRADVSVETLGPILVAPGGTHAAVGQRITFDVRGVRTTEEGLSLFTLQRADGRVLVASHTWWRRQTEAPPIGWVFD